MKNVYFLVSAGRSCDLDQKQQYFPTEAQLFMGFIRKQYNILWPWKKVEKIRSIV